ncbi:hypothetical protein TDB9533_04004 [Thalassocella blandensis]|nr:hypothetical protein TDB9533_04004 [Thalassocella blandensis]
MFKLIYKDKTIGTSLLESGDPSNCSASGALTGAGSAIALSQWIMDNGGAEDDNVFLLELDKSALLMLNDSVPIPFAEGSIICAPEGDEIYLELVGIPGPEYAQYFPQHVASLPVDGEG